MSEAVKMLILFVMGAALAVFLMVCYSIGADWQEQRIKDSACTEDMACWDCSTMGNKQCAPAQSITKGVRV